jgi:hypothetical protein
MFLKTRGKKSDEAITFIVKKAFHYFFTFYMLLHVTAGRFDFLVLCAEIIEVFFYKPRIDLCVNVTLVDFSRLTYLLQRELRRAARTNVK